MDKQREFPPQLFVFIDHDEEGEWPVAHVSLDDIAHHSAIDRIGIYELKSVNAFPVERMLTKES